jgi:hypothetical protein
MKNKKRWSNRKLSKHSPPPSSKTKEEKSLEIRKHKKPLKTYEKDVKKKELKYKKILIQ